MRWKLIAFLELYRDEPVFREYFSCMLLALSGIGCIGIGFFLDSFTALSVGGALGGYALVWWMPLQKRYEELVDKYER